MILFLWSYTSGGENIIVEYEKLYFNPDTINNFNQFAKSYKFKIRYFYGYLVKFDKVNVYAISPHKILFTKNNTNLLVLNYDCYIENDNLYFVDGDANISVDELKEQLVDTKKRYEKALRL